MGIHDRDYFQDRWKPRRYGPSRRGGGFADWEVWKQLIAINIVVFVLQIIITRPSTSDDLRRIPYFDPEMYAVYDEEYYDQYVAEADAENDADAEPDAPTESAETNADEPQPGDDAAEATSDGQDEAAADKLEKKKSKQDPAARQRARREAAERARREMMLAYMPRVSILQEWFELDSQKVGQGQVWRLITAGFCHDRLGMWHLLINMLFLFWFGKRLERVYGSAEFIAFYFTALLVASLAYVSLDVYTNTNIPAIGASGAVWGVVALYALMYPYERIYIYFLFPIEIRWLVLLYFIFDLHPVLLALSGENQFTGVAHAAHIGGAIFGFCYWNQGWRLMPLVDRLKADAQALVPRPRESKNSPDVVEMRSPIESADAKPTPERNVDRMDEILAKISTQGRDALTDEELEFLESASRKIRDERRGQ